AVNNQATYISPITGTANLNLGYVSSFTDFVGYFPIQVPGTHQGTITVSTIQSAIFDNLWDFSAFDASGQSLAVNSSDAAFGFTHHTMATIQVPSGDQTIYLRVHARKVDNAPDAILTLAITQAQNARFSPPPATLPASDPAP